MSTRQRRQSKSRTSPSPLRDERIDVDSLSDAELEALLFEEEAEPESGFWNLPTALGLSLITVGIIYLLQEMGVLAGFDLGALTAMLPILAGVMIILIGFGVLSWRPRSKRRGKAVDVKSGKERVVVEKDVEDASSGKKKLTRSRTDRKIFGVCGGIAERLNIDPTLVRIIFVVGTVLGQGAFFVAYLALAYLMPNPEKGEERIMIIRDSE